MHKYLWISAIVIFLDQLSKTAVEYYMYHGQRINILPFFDLTLVYNRGAAFGIFSQQSGWQRWFILMVAILVVIFLTRWLFSLKKSERLIAIFISFILGGAIGNIIDRAYYGHVIDFLDFYIDKFHWPAFNIADSAVVIGVFLMIWDIFRKPRAMS